MESQPVYALYDPTDKVWLGDDDGVRTFEDNELALAANTIVFFQGYPNQTEVREYDGTANNLRDHVPHKLSFAEALKAAESDDPKFWMEAGKRRK